MGFLDDIKKAANSVSGTTANAGGKVDAFSKKAASAGKSAGSAAAQFASSHLPYEDAAIREIGYMKNRRVYVGLYDNVMRLKTPGEMAKKVMNVVDLGFSPFGKGQDAQERTIPYRQITDICQNGRIGITELVISTASDSVTFKVSGKTAAEIRNYVEARM